MYCSKLPVAILALCLPSLAMAAERAAADFENGPGSLEEVVVSAFRRAPVIDLQGSLSVLDQAVIEAAAVENFQELIGLVPNMSFSGDGNRARYFQLRGVGELEQYEGAPNPSIGFIVDDIDLSGVGGINPVFDLERVEVLRGPQATRFGANALAGMVYLESARPTREFEMHAQALAGNDSALAAGLAVGGGLADDLSGRLALHHFQSDGFYDNVSLGVGDSNGRDETSARGKLEWAPEGNWRVRLNLLYADYDNGYDAWSPENGRVTYSDNPGRDEQETLGAALRIEGSLTGAEFVSISSYARSDILFSFDGEWGDADYWAPYGYDYVYSDQRRRHALTQELRLLSSPEDGLWNGRGAWVLGAYAQRLDESDTIVSRGLYDDSADAPFSYCTPCLDYTTLDSDYDATNYAVFARLDLDLDQHWSLKSGLRFEHWSADYSDAFRDFVYGDPATPIRNAFAPSEQLWGGDLGLDYRLSGSSLVYVLVSRGYKAGGFNPSLARALGSGGGGGPGDPSIVFDPEYLLNYEAGLKAAWLDGAVDATLSLFWMDRSDMQLRSSAQFSDNPNDFVFITSNADGHVYGLESTLSWQLAEAWRLHGGLGLLHSEIDSYALQREADIDGELVGRAFAHAPSYTANLGATWTHPGGWFARLDFYAVGAYYFDYSHDEKSDPYQLVNLKFGREWERWAAYAWVRNLFDEDYYTRGFSFGLEPPNFPRSRYTRLGDPRYYGVTLTWRY